MRLFKKKSVTFLPPASGRLMELSEVPDEAFAQKMLGDGYAVDPTNGAICAPIDGVISYIFPTKHAFGLESGEFEVLVHIGIDTVQLKGEGFKALKAAGDQVKAGEVVIEVDLDVLRQANKPTITPVIITPKGDKQTIRLDFSKNQVDVS